LFIDDYKKGWAARYLREAKADLVTAEKTPAPLVAISMATLAMKKAQAAVYYSLGDPLYLDPMIRQIAEEETPVHDPLLHCLVKIERKIRARSEMTETLTKEETLKEAGRLIEVATDIVEAVTGEKTGEYA
jgi:hypothetical protein